jgi:hypothetical protein
MSIHGGSGSATLVLALPEIELEQVGAGHHVEGGGLTAVLQPHQGQAPGAADPGQQPDQLKQTTVAWNLAYRCPNVSRTRVRIRVQIRIRIHILGHPGSASRSVSHKYASFPFSHKSVVLNG